MEPNSPIASLPYRLLAFLALAGLAVFGCVSNGDTRFYTWPWVFYGELLLLTPIALLALDLWRDPVPRLARRTVWALLAIAVSIGLSTALSLRPLFSLEVALFLWGSLALIALVARRFAAIAPDNGTQIGLRLAGVLLALPVLSGAILWIRDIAPHAPHGGPLDFLLWLRLQRNPYPAGHWNYTAGLALLALPWLGTLAWRERGRWRALWLLLATIATVVLFSAASRGATLGILAMLALLAAAAFASGRLQRRHILLLGFGTLAAAALLVAANPRVRASLAQGSGSFVPTEGDVQRLGMIQGGTRLFLARPVVGHGAGMTPFVYPSVRTQLVGGVETSFQLHNAPLQWAVDLGLVGLAAAAFLGLTLLAAARQWWRRSATDPLRPYALAGACTLVGYGALALTDYQLSVVAISAALAFHVGFLLAGLPAAGAASDRPRRAPIPGLALLGAAAAAAFLIMPHWKARELFWSAWWTIEAKDEPAIVARLRAAADAAPWNPHYRTHLGLRLADHAADAAGRSRARTELERSLALDPLQEPVEAALGWLGLSDDPAQAERHFRAALALVPDRDTVHLGLAFALLGQNRPAEAVRALATECVVNPEFITSPLWQAEPLAGLRAAVATETDRQFAATLAHAELPQWRLPALRYARAFVRWWGGGAAPDAAELAGATTAQQAAYEFLTATAPSDCSPDTALLPLASATPRPLQTLQAALAQPARSAALLSALPSIGAPARDGARARLAVAPRAPLGDLLRLPSPDGRGLTSTKITRGHFAIMQRNNDGTGYPDLCPRLRDSFADTFAGPLYPQRGLVPGPVLHALDL
ncbi:MAG TPA: O-antigen ligase family protein [Opitutaceae bacterium]|nr:O-antigen ligase family protein [Opitutaceae bacterium]